MSIIGQNINDDGGIYHGFKQGSYHRQSGSREHRGQNMRYNQQQIPEHEHSMMKASVDGKLIQKHRQSSERLVPQQQQSSTQRRQAELSREQVIRMKAERNCLRNMSSSSDEEDLYPRHGSKQVRNSNHIASGQQYSRKTTSHVAQQFAEKPVELIRNTNHHKSQSTWDAVNIQVNGHDSHRQSQNDMVINGAHRISYDESHYQQEHLKTTVSMSFNQLPQNSGLPPHAFHERRMSSTMVDPSMRSSNPGHPASVINKQSARLSKMRVSASQSSLLAKQVDKNGKLDEIIKRSQELRDRRKQSQSRASSRDRQRDNARNSVLSNGRQSKKAMMQTMLNVPEPQILSNTRPSLVSASGDFSQHPQAVHQQQPSGMLTSFAHADAFEQAAGHNGLNQYQHPFAGPATSREDINRSSQNFDGYRQSSLGANTGGHNDLQDGPHRGSCQENEVKSKLLNQLSQNLQKQRQRQMKSLGNADDRDVNGSKSFRKMNSRLADQYQNQELNVSGDAAGSRPATMFERTANCQKDKRKNDYRSNLQLEYTQPEQLMNTINFDNNQVDDSRHRVNSFVSSSSGAPAQKKQQSQKPLKPPKSVKNGKLPKDLKQKGSRSQYFEQQPQTVKGNQKILFTEQQMSSASKHNNQDYVRYMEGMDLMENENNAYQQNYHDADQYQRQNYAPDAFSHSRSRERQTGPTHTDASGLSHCLSQRNVKLSNYQHLMQKQKRMTMDSMSQQQSPVPRVVSVQDQHRYQQNQMTGGSHGRRDEHGDGRPTRPRTNTEFQQFLLMQDGIKQIQNAIKNKLSSYFNEIKEYSNLQGQTQYFPTQQNGRSVHEAFDAYRASLKSIHESKEKARDLNNQSGLKQLSETGQLSLAQRYDLLKKQSSSVKMREKNRQLKKQNEERGTTPNSAADGTLEQSIDTVRKTFEEKLRSLKEDFHRNLNEIATVKMVTSNSGSKLPDLQSPNVPVHQIYISGKKSPTEIDLDRSPPPLTQHGIHPAHQPPMFPNSDRGKPRCPPSNKQHKTFLKDDCGSGVNSARMQAHQDGDMAVGPGRGGGSQLLVREKFGGEEDDECLRLKGKQESEVLGASSKIMRILQNDTLSRQVCQAVHSKYRLKLEKGFNTWRKITRLQRMQPTGSVNYADRQQIMKSLFEDFEQRQKTAKMKAMFKWKAFFNRMKKENQLNNSQISKNQKSVLKKMKQRMAHKFHASRQKQLAKQVLCALIVQTQKSRALRKEQTLRLKFLIKQIDLQRRQTKAGPRNRQKLEYFERWKNNVSVSVEHESDKKAVIVLQQANNPAQVNYRYSYTKNGTNPPMSNSRTASRGAVGSEHAYQDPNANPVNLQPFRCTTSALQLGSNGGQYRSASSMQSGSHKSLKGAPAAGATSSCKKQVNQRYGKQAARRYDHDSYQDDDEDEEEEGEEPIELSAIVAKGNGIRTGDVSREESVKNITQVMENEVASRSLEVNQGMDSLRDSCLPLEFIKNQTQAIKIENYGAQMDESMYRESRQPNRSPSPSSGSKSQFNKACIIGSPDTTENQSNEKPTPSDSRILSSGRGEPAGEQNQIQKMRAQLKALQREYQREQDKKDRN